MQTFVGRTKSIMVFLKKKKGLFVVSVIEQYFKSLFDGS